MIKFFTFSSLSFRGLACISHAPSAWGLTDKMPGAPKPVEQCLTFCKISLFTIILFALFLPTPSLYAQNAVTAMTQVLPPYSPYLSDYTSYNNRIVLMLTNNVTNEVQEIRLAGTLTGNNGVSLTIPISYIPPSPITLMPRQTLRLTGQQLSQYLNENIVQLQGITQQDLLFGGGLPEGSYQLCLRAVDYRSGRFLSMPEPMGCAVFNISYLEPPMLLQPQCGTIVQDTHPQNLFFSWSIPAGANPGEIEYILKIAEMYPQDIDPNQAMQVATNPPFFEKVVHTNTYLYSLADPILEKGKKYAFRVTAQPKGGAQQRAVPGRNIPNFRNNGNSEVCSFSFGSAFVADDLLDEPKEVEPERKPKDVKQAPVIADQADDLQDVPKNKKPNKGIAVLPPAGFVSNEGDPVVLPMVANCNTPTPFANTTAVNTFGPNDIVNIGEFTLRLGSELGEASLEYDQNNLLTGEGVITNLHFKVPLKVTFDDISINSDGQVFSGEVYGKDDANMPTNWARDFLSDFTDVDAEGNLQDVAQMLQDEYQDRVKSFPWQEYYAVGLPVGIQRSVAGTPQTVAIVGALFTPGGAALNGLLQIEIPQYNQKIVMGAKNFCIEPSGLTQEGELHLLEDIVINPSGNVSFRLDHSTMGNLGTYALWGTEGFETLQIQGAIEFTESIMHPVSGVGPVAAEFTVVTEGGFSDWKAEGIDIEPFELNALPGYAFDVTNAGYDHSELSNLVGINFPGGYPSGGNLWTGMYIESVAVGLPEYFNAGNTTFTATQLIIDDAGFSGTLTGNEIFGADGGSMGSWPMSMDGLSITLLQNNLVGGSITGEVRLPLAVEGLDYAAMISYKNAEDSQLDYNFAISPQNGLQVPLWAFADIDIHEQSWLEVDLVDGQFEPQAVLFGQVTFLFDDEILQDNDVLSINFPDIEVEGLVVSPDGLSMHNGVNPFSHASPQKVMAEGFDVSLNSITLQGAGGLNLGMDLSMDLTGSGDGNGFGAGANLLFEGVWQSGQLGLDKVSLQGISAHGDFGVFEVSGGLYLHKDDPVYGNGFDGNINLNIKALGNGSGLGLELDVMFGNMPTYKYWFVEGNVGFSPASIPITGTVHLHGFMGGAYWHMRKEADGTYVPDNSKSLGLQAGVTIGLPSEAKNVFHATTEMEILFNNNFGVSLFELRGSAYLMSAPIDLSEVEDFDFASVSGEGYKGDGVNSQNGEPVIIELTCRAQVLVDEKKVRIEAGFEAGLENILYSTGSFESEFSPAGWFIKLGTPVNPISLQVAFLSKKEGYFMLGTLIPGIPDIPDPVINIISDNGGNLPPNVNNRKEPPAGNFSNEVDESNFGIVMGYFSGTGKSADEGREINASFFYAKLSYGLGFDLSLETLNSCGLNGPNGKNWYAQGQVYAWVDAAVGVKWKLFRDTPRDVPLGSLELAALMTAGGPSPTYITGNIAGKGTLFGRWEKSFSFDFIMGETEQQAACATPDDFDPLDDLKLIADIRPRTNDSPASVFADPQAGFSLPVNFRQEVIPLEAIEEGVEKNRYFTFELRHIKVYKVENGNLYPAWPQGEESHEIIKNKAFDKYTYKSSRALPEETKIRVEVSVDIWECANASCTYFIGENDQFSNQPIKTETDFVEFTTGELPEQISLNHLEYTLPGIYQRYYLQGDANGVGYFEFKEQKYVDIITENAGEYHVRFVPLNGELKKTGEYLGVDGKRIMFSHPLIDFNTIQYFQLFRRTAPLDPAINHAVGGLKDLPNTNNPDGLPTFPTNNSGAWEEDLPKITQKQLLIAQTQLSDKDVHVFGYYFKTSKFHKLQDKVANLDFKDVDSNGKIHYIKYTAEEPFDTYDHERLIRIDWNPEYKFYSPPPRTWVYNYFEPHVDEASFILKFYADNTVIHNTPHTKIYYAGVEKLTQDEVDAALGKVLKPLPTPGNHFGAVGGFAVEEDDGGLFGMGVGNLVIADPVYKMAFMGEYFPYWIYQNNFMPRIVDLSNPEILNCLTGKPECKTSGIKTIYNYALSHSWKDLYEATYQLKYRYKPNALEYWNDNTTYYKLFTTKPYATQGQQYTNE